METASGTAPAAEASLDREVASDRDRRLARAIELYQSGASTREVGAELGVAASTIERWLERAGVPRRRRGPRISHDERQRIDDRRRRVAAAHAADDGLTIASTAHAEGVSAYTIWRDLEASGIARRRPGRRALYADSAARVCRECGRGFVAKPSRVARGYGSFCSNRCKTTHRWRVTGHGISDVMLANASALAGVSLIRRFKGRWASRKPPRDPTKTRGRPGLSVDGPVAERVLSLRADHPEWGRETLARAAGTTPAHVRKILASRG